MDKKIIAIIEDDRAINRGIAIALGEDKYTFLHCFCLADVKETPRADLFILDLNLPDGNGLDFLKRLRQTAQTPVLVLTANDTEMDEVIGLELGADDYMTKPFSLAVLRLRAEKLLRQQAAESRVIKTGVLTLDFERLLFLKDGAELELSKNEIRLLRYFTENPNRTLSREQIITYVWQDQEYVEENALSVTVKRLRGKIEDGEHKYISTVYGIGYVFKWSDANVLA